LAWHSVKQRVSGAVAVTAGLALAIVVAPVANGKVGADDPPKVEFIAVLGRPCLQPLVNDATAELADYRAAEARWLAAKYPGVAAPRAETVILLSPLQGSDGRPERTTVQTETFHLDGVVGPDAVVCFEINLTTIGSQQEHN
jgi:hypothetical protein